MDYPYTIQSKVQDLIKSIGKIEKSVGATENAGVENVAPDDRGGKRGSK